MASAAEQMAANLSWSTLGKATELRQRIFFTIGLLIVYRIGTYIPVPGIDAVALQQFMDEAASGIGGVLSMFLRASVLECMLECTCVHAHVCVLLCAYRWSRPAHGWRR